MSKHLLAQRAINGLIKRLWLTTLVICACCAGCTVIKGALELPDKAIQSLSSSLADGEKADPVELQSQLIRFSDRYLETMYSAFRQLRRDGEQQSERRRFLRKRIIILNDVLAIATGTNAYANLLDMIVLVTLNRNNAEYSVSNSFDESAKPLLMAARDSEKEIWRIAEASLKREQIDELRNNIDAWLGQYGSGRARRDVGTLGLSGEIAKMHKTGRSDTSSVFNLLTIDPFAGLDPATRELANTRLFAERGLFLTRHMPALLSLETELLAIRSFEIPQLDSLLASISQLSAAAERFSQVSEQLPSVMSSEREQIVKALDLQRPGLISLAAQTEKALNAGQFMSEATNATLQTFQAVVQQLVSSSDPKSKPFEIGEYTAMAVELNNAAQQLTKLLEVLSDTLNQEQINALSEKVELLSQRAESSGKQVVDYAFGRILWLGIILIIFCCLMFLSTYYCYCRLKKRYSYRGVVQ